MLWRFLLSLNKDQIKYLAVLSRMNLQDSETNDVVDKLSRIVEFVDQLQAVSTEGIASSISKPIVPCPAIILRSSKGWINSMSFFKA